MAVRPYILLCRHDCALSVISLTQHHSDAHIFHTCDSLPLPSVLPIQTHVEGSHAKTVTKDHRALPRLLCTCMSSVHYLTLRVTSIQIQLSSGHMKETLASHCSNRALNIRQQRTVREKALTKSQNTVFNMTMLAIF